MESICDKRLTIIRAVGEKGYLITDNEKQIDEYIEHLNYLDVDIEKVKRLGKQNIILCNEKLVSINVDQQLDVDEGRLYRRKITTLYVNDGCGRTHREYVIGRTDKEIYEYIDSICKKVYVRPKEIENVTLITFNRELVKVK